MMMVKKFIKYISNKLIQIDIKIAFDLKEVDDGRLVLYDQEL